MTTPSTRGFLAGTTTRSRGRPRGREQPSLNILGQPSTIAQPSQPASSSQQPEASNVINFSYSVISDMQPRKSRNERRSEVKSREESLQFFTITKSLISLYSWEQMQRIGVVNVTVERFTTNLAGTVNDPKMGEVSKTTECANCGQIDCTGHFGLIKFENHPIYNPAYIKQIVFVLTCVCNTCGGLLIPPALIEEKGFSNLRHNKRLAAMARHCENLECTNPKSHSGGGVSPCHKNPTYSIDGIKDKGDITYRFKDDTPQSPSVEQVYIILDAISDTDARLLGFPEGSHPRDMIMRGILVPPIIARPPVQDGGIIRYDQLTHAFVGILRKVNELKEGKRKSDDTKVQNSRKELYCLIRQLIFKTEGKKMGNQDFMSIVERIQGKFALLRNLLMGKRVNYCGRTVSGGAPELHFGQVRIPRVWAPVQTKPVKVNLLNINYLKYLLRKGYITHITPKITGLRCGVDPKFNYQLQIGDIVDRELQDNDRTVVNRQPTLHRQSMMGYRVKLGEELTTGLHLSYTTPMNNDFDGDENNVWTPQDLETEAEVELLMNVIYNVMSSEQNKPIMGLVMNSVTGAYLLSNPKVRIDYDLFMELLNMMSNPNPTLYERCTMYGIHPFSGQAIISALLPSDFCYKRGNVTILNGILIQGQLKKSNVGPSHRSIIQELWKDKRYGPQRTADFFTEASWVINKWLMETGFTVGLRDVINFGTDKEGNEYDINVETTKLELAKAYVALEALGGPREDPLEERYRQRQVNNLVNTAKNVGLRLAKEVLSDRTSGEIKNAIGVMTDQGAGTKGAIANIGQIMGSVGQQFYRGERLKPTITQGKRLLPTYDENDQHPEAHAFIPQSFYTGLSPEGLFFLQAAGREGLMDTALKTQETGTMQRRMTKAFESIIVDYDGSVRNTTGIMFSPIYNAGYNIAEMVSVDQPGKPDFSSFIDLKSVATSLNNKRGWVTQKERRLIEKNQKELSEELKHQKINPKFLPKPNPQPYTTPVGFKASEPKLNQITRFEFTRLIGARATQIANNCPPLVDVNIPLDGSKIDPQEIDPINIAIREYNAGLMPIYVIRRFPDGSQPAYQIVRPTLDVITPIVQAKFND